MNWRTNSASPLELMVAPNTGELVDALEAGRIDVSFMPVDDERRKRIDFGPVYFQVESTYMVTQASGIRTVDEVDRPGVRVVGIAGTTTIRAAGAHAEEHHGQGGAVDRRSDRDDDRAARPTPSRCRATCCRRSWRSSPARASSRAASSSPASPSPWRRAGRRRWLMSRRSWRRRRGRARCEARVRARGVGASGRGAVMPRRSSWPERPTAHLIVMRDRCRHRRRSSAMHCFAVRPAMTADRESQ